MKRLIERLSDMPATVVMATLTVVMLIIGMAHPWSMAAATLIMPLLVFGIAAMESL